MGADETAEEHLKWQLGFASRYGIKKPSELNALTARNVLHEELGYFDGPSGRNYQIDQDVRDRLIVHGRQDAAHALLNSITILEEISRLKRLLWIALALIAVVFLYLFVGGR